MFGAKVLIAGFLSSTVNSIGDGPTLTTPIPKIVTLQNTVASVSNGVLSDECIKQLLIAPDVLKDVGNACKSDAAYLEVMTYAAKVALAEAFKNKVNSRR